VVIGNARNKPSLMARKQSKGKQSQVSLFKFSLDSEREHVDPPRKSSKPTKDQNAKLKNLQTKHTHTDHGLLSKSRSSTPIYMLNGAGHPARHKRQTGWNQAYISKQSISHNHSMSSFCASQVGETVNPSFSIACSESINPQTSTYTHRK